MCRLFFHVFAKEFNFFFVMAFFPFRATRGYCSHLNGFLPFFGIFTHHVFFFPPPHIFSRLQTRTVPSPSSPIRFLLFTFFCTFFSTFVDAASSFQKRAHLSFVPCATGIFSYVFVVLSSFPGQARGPSPVLFPSLEVTYIPIFQPSFDPPQKSGCAFEVSFSVFDGRARASPPFDFSMHSRGWLLSVSPPQPLLWPKHSNFFDPLQFCTRFQNAFSLEPTTRKGFLSPFLFKTPSPPSFTQHRSASLRFPVYRQEGSRPLPLLAGAPLPRSPSPFPNDLCIAR